MRKSLTFLGILAFLAGSAVLLTSDAEAKSKKKTSRQQEYQRIERIEHQGHDARDHEIRRYERDDAHRGHDHRGHDHGHPGHPGAVIHEPHAQPGVVVINPGLPDCEHKCCRKRDRLCRHECEPACPPVVEYKGCPAPCSVDKIITVTNPKTCVTIDVVVQVPADRCEKIDRDRDGDMELDYGKYEVSLDWKDHGRRLVVHYDD